MRTLRDAAVGKVLLGETSITEVLEHTVAQTTDSGVVATLDVTAHA